MTAPEPKYLTVREVADHLRVSVMTVYRLVHADELAAVRVGRVVRIPVQGLRAFVGRTRADHSPH